MTSTKSLYEKLVDLRKHVGCLVKDEEGYGYNYVTGNQILAKVKDKMNELGLVLLPSSNVGETYYTHNYTTASGTNKTDFIVMGEMTYTWVNADDPNEKIVIPWSYYGQQDDISKAYGSALTYSERYFWLKMLGLPTDEDDPDSKNTRDNLSNQEASFLSSAAPLADKKAPKEKTAKEKIEDFKNQMEDSVNNKQDRSKTRYITERQQRRLFAIAEGNKQIVADVLSAYGYENETEVPMGKEYGNICKQIETMVSGKLHSI